jgi:hypothetical protein
MMRLTMGDMDTSFHLSVIDDFDLPHQAATISLHSGTRACFSPLGIRVGQAV